MSKEIINQRFIEVINFLISEKKVPSKSFLAEKFGISASKFSEILKERMNVGIDLLSILIDDYNINSEWLLTGKGEMLKSEVKNEVVPVEIIAPVKVEGRNLMPKVVVVDDADNDRIPLVPVQAQAGYLTNYGDPEYIEKLPTYSVPTLNNGTYRMFQVAGHSMYPTLQSNSYVIGKFVENWEDISDNRVHVVVTINEGIVVKRVLNHIKKNATIYCKSDNRDYPPLSVHVKDIKEVWECKMHLSFEFLDPVTNYQKIADLEKDMLEVKNEIAQLRAENNILKIPKR